MSQLVLGTAQFGDGYGITNARGRLDDDEVAQIMDLAAEFGVTRIDTAAVYGDALRRLRPWASAFTFTSKIVGTDPVDPVEQISRSLSALGRDSFDACLIREWDQLDARSKDASIERMAVARELGLVNRIGVAAYTEEDIHSFAAHIQHAGQAVGAIQVPANPLDRRLDSSEYLAAAAAAGVEVAVRSVFLQGILLLQRGTRFDSHADVLRYWNHVPEQRSEESLRTCLAHVKALPWVTQVVVGVSSITEWRQVLEAWSDCRPSLLPRWLASNDEGLLDPRLWGP